MLAKVLVSSICGNGCQDATTTLDRFDNRREFFGCIYSCKTPSFCKFAADSKSS